MDLEALAELERRYDGPIPPEELNRLRFGSYRAQERSRAGGMRRYFANMATSTIRGVRKRRATIEDGGYDHLPEAKRAELWNHGYADIAFYFREFRKWNRYWWQLREQPAAALPLAAE